MERVTILQHSNPDIGYFARATTPGDEYELVQNFIDFFCSKFEKDTKKHQLMVFIEPRITSGFPDIVFASYLPSIMSNWSDERAKLDTCDLKVLSFIMHTNGCSGASILSSLKLPERQTINSLEKLMDAKMISYRHTQWMPRELRDVFSIVRLVSVEAKINNMGKVAEQSLLNTWFASESYALTNSTRPQQETLRSFRSRGIGLYGKNRSFKKLLEAQEFALPSSYLSFQFNEWIAKSLAI